MLTCLSLVVIIKNMSNPPSPSFYLNLPESPSPSPRPSPSARPSSSPRPSPLPSLSSPPLSSPSSFFSHSIASPRDRSWPAVEIQPLPKKVKLTVEIREEDRARFKNISWGLSLSQDSAFVSLLNKFEENPDFMTQNERDLRKKILNFQTHFPEPRSLTTKTSQLKDAADKMKRRRDTEFLLDHSLKKINGGEWLYPMVKFFQDHPDLFHQLLEEMKAKESILSNNFPACLLDFIDLLDNANGSINVLGLRRIHKLMVRVFLFTHPGSRN